MALKLGVLLPTRGLVMSGADTARIAVYAAAGQAQFQPP